MMTFEEFKNSNFKKGFEQYGISEDEAIVEYNTVFAKEKAMIEIDVAAKQEKADFITNAVNILGKEAVIECFIETRKTRSAAEKAISGEHGLSKLTRDEIEYQLSVA